MRKKQRIQHPKKEAMIKALEKALGVVTIAAKDAGIDRCTHYTWYNEDDDYRAKVDAVQEVAIDFAESHLHKRIKEGSDAATIFFLKTKGKKRGYSEKIEHEITADTKSEIFIINGQEIKF